MSIELKIIADSAADLHQQLRQLLGDAAPTVTAATDTKTAAPKEAKAKDVKSPPAQPPTSVDAANAVPETPASTSASTEATGSVASATTTPTAPSDNDDNVLDYTRDVTPRVLAFAQKFGRDGVMELLKPFDVVNAKEIAPGKWPDLLAAIDQRFAEAA